MRDEEDRWGKSDNVSVGRQLSISATNPRLINASTILAETIQQFDDDNDNLQCEQFTMGNKHASTSLDAPYLPSDLSEAAHTKILPKFQESSSLGKRLPEYWKVVVGIGNG